ncbi:MAG: RagB/SusD family nutrient uptake outer membrane protein [Flavobacteriaceae bacterium]|nr:RagB/SusD family nutrient uptake outer membrane protein [Candidatus Onthonaster equi]
MKNIYILSLISAISALFFNCNDFLEVEIPTSQYNSELVFTDKKTTNAALISLYADIRDKGFLSGQMSAFPVSIGLYTDELDSYQINQVESQNLYNNTLQANSATVLQYWSQTYYQIYIANSIIEGCQNSKGLTSQDKNEFIGEALFVRALLHFYLVNTYGDIPYIKTTNYEVNKNISRLEKTKVYQQITQDLEEAIHLLSKQITLQRNRPNQVTAQALLARVELYKGNWESAERWASIVINTPSIEWQQDLNQEFLKENKSIIWQISPKQAGNYAYEGGTYYIATGPPTSIALTKVNTQFEPNDLREKNWVREVTSGTNTWKHAFKYKQRSNSSLTTENSVIFRLTEQFLIRAEARLKQQNKTDALNDLNKIRARAGLPAYKTLTDDKFVEAILQERKHELFCEFGHRFFDLKRMNLIDKILFQTKSNWKSYYQQWPIPEQEILKNPNLIQNTGY